MSLRITSYEELAAEIDLSDAPPGFRLVVDLDLIAHGPITRHSIAKFVRTAQWTPVSRADRPEPPGEWARHAACVGHRMYYESHQAHLHLTKTDRAIEAAALAVCASCTVRAACREWALQPVEPATDHVAGGLTPRQRWTYRRIGAQDEQP